MHSHLLPGVDDGCTTLEESLTCVHRLIQAGFAGTICTPHILPEMFPANTHANIIKLVEQFQQDIEQAGLTYRVWPGGEIRASETILDWLKTHGVPTLANSRCVLLDFWSEKWPKWMMKLFDWLLSEKYQPVLAHPERTRCCYNDPKKLGEAMKMGVWLQGNCRAMTGEDGYAADQMVRQLLKVDRYTFFALDMHRPDSLETRLDGMQLIAAEYGDDQLDRWMNENPRKFLIHPLP
jgi:protein-tyrosine phosphatase